MSYTHTRRYRLLVFTVVIVLLTTTVAPMAGSASNHKTTDDYFDTFRAMDGTEAYQEYEEFNTIRTFAVSQTQEIGTLNEQQRAELAAVEQAMVSFERAYNQAYNGEYEQRLETAQRVRESIEELREYEQTQATRANLALSRFYQNLATDIREEADANDRTPTQVDLLTMTATAYERANRPDEAAQFNLQAERRAAEYEAATKRMERSESTAEEFVSACQNCDSVGNALIGLTNPVRTFNQYQQAQTAVTEMQTAESDATTHGLEQRIAELQPLSETVNTAWLSLLIASVVLLVGYGLIVGAVSIALLVRGFAWREAYAKAQIGAVVTVGETDA